jgi:hypothetical protein
VQHSAELTLSDHVVKPHSLARCLPNVPQTQTITLSPPPQIPIAIILPQNAARKCGRSTLLISRKTTQTLRLPLPNPPPHNNLLLRNCHRPLRTRERGPHSNPRITSHNTYSQSQRCKFHNPTYLQVWSARRSCRSRAIKGAIILFEPTSICLETFSY